jgi:hypothetical protein
MWDKPGLVHRTVKEKRGLSPVKNSSCRYSPPVYEPHIQLAHRHRAINPIPIDIFINDKYITRAMNDPTHYIFKASGDSLLNRLRGVVARKW